MSYAIIRNENYKIGQLAYVYRHNERKNTNYSNKDINKQNGIKNYSLKSINTSYQKAFNLIKEKYQLKGQIKKVSNVMCELIITSDKEFFNNIGEEETKRYFKTAYSFVKNYQNLGEEFILSAKVHMDETTPHMHITFIPVVHKKDKNGKEINKIACSEFWKGKDSYKKLQDNFHAYITEAGFNLDRGNTKGNEHIPIEKLKQVTSYEMQKCFEDTKDLEQEKISDDKEIIKQEYRRIIKKYNTLASKYTKIKTIVSDTIIKAETVQAENIRLKQENQNLKQEKFRLKDYIDKTLEYVSVLFDFPKDSLKGLINMFISSLDKDR